MTRSAARSARTSPHRHQQRQTAHLGHGRRCRQRGTTASFDGRGTRGGSWGNEGALVNLRQSASRWVVTIVALSIAMAGAAGPNATGAWADDDVRMHDTYRGWVALTATLLPAYFGDGASGTVVDSSVFVDTDTRSATGAARHEHYYFYSSGGNPNICSVSAEQSAKGDGSAELQVLPSISTPDMNHAYPVPTEMILWQGRSTAQLEGASVITYPSCPDRDPDGGPYGYGAAGADAGVA